MKKRGLALLPVVFILALALLTACNTQREVKDNTVYEDHDDGIMGLTLKLPQKELADWTVLYGPFDQSVDRGEYASVDGSYLTFMPMESGITLFSIQYYDESKWDGWIKAGHTVKEITGTSKSEEIGRKGGMVYLYVPTESNDKGMSNEAKEKYQSILKMLPTIRKSITLITRGAANTGSFPSFSTIDLDGNPVENTTFSDYQITMVNIWGTFCGPCIEEMPDLEKMSKNMPEGTRLVGLVCDALDDEHQSLARKILSEKGVSFKNWIPDAALKEYMDNHVTGVPTTLFIDKNGEIVGDAIIGAVGIDEYKSSLTSRLNLTEGNSQSAGNEITANDQTSENTQPDSSKENIQKNNTPSNENKGASHAGPAPAE